MTPHTTSKRTQVDYTQLDRVRFAVDNGQLSEDPTRAKIIKKAAYQFRFPVIVPMIMPTTNIWVVRSRSFFCGFAPCCLPQDHVSAFLILRKPVRWVGRFERDDMDVDPLRYDTSWTKYFIF